jgi:ribose transport system ATP-binding protein
MSPLHDADARPGAGPVLAVRGVCKAFAGVQALRDVSLDVRRNEVHGLLGQNGSGKSTLIKILAGAYAPDSGRLSVNGEEVSLPLAPGQFRELGMSFVHQDLGLIGDLTVTENVLATELASGSAWRAVSWPSMRRRTAEVLERFGVDVDVDARVGDVSPMDRARLAIVRAVQEIRRAAADDDAYGLLILDEPTVFLSQSSVEELFALIRQVVESAASVLFVSHDLDEVMAITDRATVLKDGVVSGTVTTAEVTSDDFVRLIVGRALAAGPSSAPAPPPDDGAQSRFAVRDLRTKFLDGVAFDVGPGEVLGVTGLAGSGFEDVPYALFGALPNAEGTMRHRGEVHELNRLTPERAVASGLGLVPADRPRQGGVGSLTVGENMLLPVLERYQLRLGALARRRLQARSSELIGDFGIRAEGPDQPFDGLSGGNQQKVVLAKWFETEPELLLLHEPTQGVDIGARQEIEALLKDTASRGLPIVCASADFEELTRLCQRVLVFDEGRIVSELRGTELTKDELSLRVYGQAAGVA